MKSEYAGACGKRKMIDINKLKDSDIGRWVVFSYPQYGMEKELGRIKSWNDKWIFVVYACGGQWSKYADYTGCASDPYQLNFSTCPSF